MWARKEMSDCEGRFSKHCFHSFTCNQRNTANLIYQVEITISFPLALQVKINVDLK